jgi:hypothetical protein
MLYLDKQKTKCSRITLAVSLRTDISVDKKHFVMTNKFFIVILLAFVSLNSHGQKDVLSKIRFKVDTSNVYKKIVNRQDSAYFNMDGGFVNDTVTIIVDGKIKLRGVFTSGESTDYAGFIAIPKTKQTVITIKINGHIFQSFDFNKNFYLVHLDYYEKKLQLTYTNRIYEYD